MKLQFVIVVIVVAICGLVVLRSWYAFWSGLIRKPDPNQASASSCSGCVNGCQRASSGPQLIELKRESKL